MLTWRGLQRLAYLTHVAYLHLAWLVYACGGEGERLALSALAFGSVPKFPYYRIGEALAEALDDADT